MPHELQISDVDFHLIQPQQGLIGFTNFLIEGAIAINGVGIYERLDRTGIRLVYPVRRLTNGKQINLIHPISQQVGFHIERQIKDYLFDFKKVEGKHAEKRLIIQYSE